ncbi:MAG: hypothetical protein QXN15_11450 [Candidatus Jordarchaeales archaeon]|nr:hypothetical protein [Candidatus Jordarchaeia archaeon]
MVLCQTELFQAYRQILSELLDYACDRGVSSFKRLKSEKYCDLRARYPSLPISAVSWYIGLNRG